MKLFIAGLMTETNTFSPFPTTLADFKRVGRDDDFIAVAIGAQLDVFRRGAEERGWEVARGIGAGAMPAGRTTAEAYSLLRNELLRDLERAMPVDVVVLALHGAMAAHGCDDCEGDILSAARAIVGPGVPIGALLDPHSNLSRRMVENADILVCYKEWPHVDVFDRAADVFRLTADAAERRTRPRIALWDCRMLDFFHTMEEPMKSFVDELRAREGKDGVLSLSVVHGFPFSDNADGGTKILAITDGDEAAGARLAKELGLRLFALRGKAHPRHLTVEEGIEAVARAARRPVIVADTADAPGGGAPGDATYVLHALLDAGIRDVALAYLWDPVAVSVCHAAGEGARLDLRIGGKMGRASGFPLDLAVEIVRAEKSALVVHDGMAVSVGDIAVVRSGETEVVLSSERPIAMHADYFAAHGIDPAKKNVLVVKSVNQFRAGYEHLDGTFVYVSGPGAMDSSLRSLVFEKITRPRWPFDDDPFAEGTAP